MLKEILLEKNITTYKLAKDIGEPYSTLNDIVNGKIDISDCKAKILKKLSEYLGQSMEETYKQCSTTIDIYSKDYNIHGQIVVKLKKYHLCFKYDNQMQDMELCKVTEGSTMFVKEAALYEMERFIKEAKMEEYVCSMK